MEFSFETLKNKYSKRVGNYKGRDVIVRSKYDTLGDNVYILFDYNNALIVDGYWIANISEDGALRRREPSKWESFNRDSVPVNERVDYKMNEIEPSYVPIGINVDDILNSVYTDSLLVGIDKDMGFSVDVDAILNSAFE